MGEEAPQKTDHYECVGCGRWYEDFSYNEQRSSPCCGRYIVPIWTKEFVCYISEEDALGE